MFTVSQHPHPSSEGWYVLRPDGQPYALGTFDYCAMIAARCQRILDAIRSAGL